MKVNPIAAMTAVVALTTAFSASPAFGEVLATADACTGFRIDTSGNPVLITSSAQVDISCLAGQTVTATAPNGTSAGLTTPGSAAATVAFAPDAGGLWTLVNSIGETVLAGVAWSVFDDGWSQNGAAYSPFVMHTDGDGPNRRVRMADLPPVAYSGDDWRRDVAAASTLTFTSPAGVETVLNRAGTGVQTFRFNVPGQWTVSLEMADGTVTDALITVSGGLTVIIR